MEKKKHTFSGEYRVLMFFSILLHFLQADGFDGTGEPNTSYNIYRKGLGIGGADGPVWLDDVKRLQRSNEVVHFSVFNVVNKQHFNMDVIEQDVELECKTSYHCRSFGHNWKHIY